MFGFPSLLSQEAPLADAVTTEPAVIYRIPETLFRTTVGPPPVRPLLPARAERPPAHGAPRRPPLGDQGLGDAGEIPDRPPADLCDAGRHRAGSGAVMTDANVSSVLVADDPPGILTDRDLRRRVLATGRGPETPVKEVMSRPLVSLDSDTPVHGAMMLMLEQQIHHLALVEEGEIVGLVSPAATCCATSRRTRSTCSASCRSLHDPAANWRAMPRRHYAGRGDALPRRAGRTADRAHRLDAERYLNCTAGAASGRPNWGRRRAPMPGSSLAPRGVRSRSC